MPDASEMIRTTPSHAGYDPDLRATCTEARFAGTRAASTVTP